MAMSQICLSCFCHVLSEFLGLETACLRYLLQLCSFLMLPFLLLIFGMCYELVGMYFAINPEDRRPEEPTELRVNQLEVSLDTSKKGRRVYEGRPKTPVFGFNYRRTGRSKSCQKLCARKERASAAQGTRKVTYSFEGFHVLMLPSFMKRGDIFLLHLCHIFLLHLCLSNQSDAKRSQSFCGHDFNNQQLTRQNPLKPRASRAQVARKHEKPQQDI